jgi:LPS-assembly protein
MKNARVLLSMLVCVLASFGVFATGAVGQDAADAIGDVQVRSDALTTVITVDYPFALPEEDRTEKRPGLSSQGKLARVHTPKPKAKGTPKAGEEEEVSPEEAAEGEEAEPTPTPEAEPSGAPAPTPTPNELAIRPGAVTINEIHLFFPNTTIDRSRVITVDDRIIQEVRLFADEGGVSMTVVVRRPVYYVVVRRGGQLEIDVEPGTLLLEESAGQPQTTKPSTTIGAKGPRPKSKGQANRGFGGAAMQQGQLTPKIAMPAMRKGEGLTVDAEHLNVDEDKNEVVAQGHVTIARAGSLLTADEIRINRDTQLAAAKGNVEFTDPQGTLQADDFSGNLEDETGELHNGTIYLSANRLTISGEKLQKSYGQTYHIENGQFTTCQCGAGAPSWSIAGKSIDITLDGYGLVEDGTFRVLDVPVLYLPYAPLPAKRTRQSGLLAPIFGYSKKRGFEYMQPIYWVINKSADFTISPDIETEARVGAISEYRWALDKKSKGVIDVAYFNESIRTNANDDVVNTNIADPTIPENRWSVTGDIRQQLPYDVRAFADALAVSDDLYLREIPTFSFDPEHARTLRTSRFDSSTVGLYKAWDNATLIAKGTYYQDFVQEQDLVFQRLPEVQFFGSQRFFDRHLKLGVNSEFDDFVRKQGFDGTRIDLAPTATVPFRYQEYVNGNVALQLRETAYHLNNTDNVVPVSQGGGVEPAPPGTPPLGKSPTREIMQATATLGTQLSRVFDIGGEDVRKLKHTIEPEVDYLFVPDVFQDDLPTYDFVDRINRRNLLTYGFTSRLLAKLANAPPAEMRNPLSVGDLTAVGGITPSPFDDERTRGGIAALGDPTISAPTPYGVGSTLESTTTLGLQREPGTEAETPEEQKAMTPAERAEKAAEEKSAVSHVVEWVRLQVFQSYDIRDPLQQTQSGNSTDHFSDVDLHLRLTPLQSFSLTYDSTVNAVDTRLTSAAVGMLLRDPRERSLEGILTGVQRASLGVSYRLISEGVVQEVDGNLVVPLADTISTFYQTRYDALAHEFLEKTGGLRLSSQCKCWIFDVAVSDQINPNETQVRFQVTLVGLGSIGRAR